MSPICNRWSGKGFFAQGFCSTPRGPPAVGALRFWLKSRFCLALLLAAVCFWTAKPIALWALQVCQGTPHSHRHMEAFLESLHDLQNKDFHDVPLKKTALLKCLLCWHLWQLRVRQALVFPRASGDPASFSFSVVVFLRSAKKVPSSSRGHGCGSLCPSRRALRVRFPSWSKSAFVFGNFALSCAIRSCIILPSFCPRHNWAEMHGTWLMNP